jgi:hypothetical protein
VAPDLVGKPKEAEPHPFDVFIASVIVLYMLGFDCVFEDRPLAAYGLALVAAAAVIATPNLIFNSITKQIAASPKRANASRRLRSATLRSLVIGFSLTALSAILAKQDEFHISHTLIVVCALAGGAFVALGTLFFALYLVVSIGLVDDVPKSDASQKKSFREVWKGIEAKDRLWFFAGCLFFVGTLIQFLTV